MSAEDNNAVRNVYWTPWSAPGVEQLLMTDHGDRISAFSLILRPLGDQHLRIRIGYHADAEWNTRRVMVATANAEETASAAEEMSAQAEQMMAQVRELMVFMGKSSHGTKRYPAAEAKRFKKVIHKSLTGAAPVETAKSKTVGVRPNKVATPEEIIPLDVQDFKDF